MKRRTVDFKSSQEVIQDIESLRDGGYARTGNWNLTQICQHLTATMTGGMDGFGFRVPWILRATVMPPMFRYLLNKRKLYRGAPTFKMLKPAASSDASDDPEVIDACIECCRRAQSFEGPIENYPLLNEIDVDDWREFMWIHAAHHLSFLVPS